jgi:hypothetical protein
MASAKRKPKTPLQHYLPVQNVLDRQLATILYDAAAHAEKLILQYEGKVGIGAKVDIVQLRAMKRSLKEQADAYWKGIGTATGKMYGPAAVAAAESGAAELRAMLREHGLSPSEYRAAKLIQAVDGVPALLARGANGIPLAESVYGSANLANGWVDRTINRGILLGRSAKQIAADVAHLIRPDVRGGVSYAAFRLGRTELNNAFHRTYINQHQDEPWVYGFKWNLSGSHPEPDECNEYAQDTHYAGGEPGVFRTDAVPGKPHPQCLCYVTAEMESEEEFMNNLLNEHLPYMDHIVKESALPTSSQNAWDEKVEKLEAKIIPFKVQGVEVTSP